MRDRKRAVEMEKKSGKQQRTGSKASRITGASSRSKNSTAAEESEEDEDSQSEEEDDVSRALFYYADNIISEGINTRGMESELQQAKRALEKCKFLLLHEQPLLQKMLKKASSRDMSDKKVPPGSSSVQRSLLDDRFLLSLVCINFSKLQGIIDQDSNSAIQSLKDALVFFPRSAEANENIAQYLRIQADTVEKLNAVENFLRKSVSCKEQILLAIQECSTSRATISLLSAAAKSTKSVKSAVAGSSSKIPTTKTSEMEIENENENENNDGDENEEEGDDEDEDDEADLIECEMLQRILERELSACERATENLTLFLCQENRNEEASEFLKKGNYSVRLSKNVLCYEMETKIIDNSELKNSEVEKMSKKEVENEVEKEEEIDIECNKIIRVADNTLSKEMLTNMQHIFRPLSPFWSEHNYDSTANSSRTAGYFSYVYELKKSPSNYIEQIIQVLFESVKEMFPTVCGGRRGDSDGGEEDIVGGEGGGVGGGGGGGGGGEVTGNVGGCQYAEWWVHSRPHTSGHQLHFDSDNEGMFVNIYQYLSIINYFYVCQYS